MPTVDSVIAATDGVALEDPAAGDPSGSQAACHRYGHRPPRRSSLEVFTPRDVLESSEELLFLELRPPIFALVWLGMFFLHVFCAVLLALQAQLYVYLTSPYMSYYVHLIQPGVARMYRAVAIVFGLLSVVHWNVVLRLCYYSLQQRKFAFFPANHYAPPESHHANHSNGNKGPESRWMRFKSRAHTIHVTCFSRRGVFGVESSFFYVYFYLREFVELSSQIYQAYRASLLVARPWLNNLSVVIIIVNCFSTPAIQYWFKKRPEMRRVYLLAIDAVLDFAVAVIVPVSIFAPYARAFDFETRTFPSEKLADQRWLTNAVLENQEIFVISTLDLVFKIIPHLSIRGCLKKVRALVRKDTSVTPTTPHGQSVKVFTGSVVSASERSLRFQAKVDRFHKHQQQLADAKESEASCSPQPMTQSQAEVHKQHAALRSNFTRGHRMVSKIAHKYAGKLLRLLFLAIGVAITFIHGLAFRTSYYGDKTGCWQIMRPWFATKLSCSVYQVDCNRLGGIHGNASQVEKALEKLHVGSVAALLFTHCPGLEIPAIIREYHHLMLIDVYNSTLASWPLEAAITHRTNPRMVSLSFARVNFTSAALPAGITSDDHPRGLSDVKISTTNLIDLPNDLHSKWPEMTKLFVENSQLSQFPVALVHLRVEKLSLEANRITELPAALFRGEGAQSYFTLALSHNPLLELPAAADVHATIRYFHLHSTNLSALPPWVYEKLAAGDITRIFAHNTPFCARMTPRESGETHSDDADIACVFDSVADPLGNSGGMYPLAFMDKQLGVRGLKAAR